MEEKWEDLQKKMQEEVKHTEIDVPESLQPDQIEQMLNGKISSDKAKKMAGRTWKRASVWVAAAACCLLVIGGIAGGRFMVQRVAEIANSQNDETSASKTESADRLAVEEAEATVAAAKDYSEIYDYLKEQEQESVNSTAENEIVTYDADTATGGATASSNGATAAAISESGAAKSESMDSGGVYSDTNVRQEGVGEADTVKTDGKYIYTLKDGMYIQIVDVQDPQMELTATIDMSKSGQASEFYVSGNQLFVFYNEDDSSDQDGAYIYRTKTSVKTYDISDPANPKEKANVSQSGDYYTSRVVGDYLYIVSQFYVYGLGNSQEDTAVYLPYVQGKPLSADRIYMPMVSYGRQYTIISSIDMNHPEEVCDTKALLSASGMCYVSNDSIYMCESVYSNHEDYNQTAIRKINYKDGMLTAAGQTKIWGTLNDSFSIDEYDGYLRLVTTVTPQNRYNDGIRPITSLKDFITNEDAQSETKETEAYNPDSSSNENGDTSEGSTTDSSEEKETNALYILDDKLNVVSKLEGLAEDEQVYSARFLGDTAYFVTYKQVDPLFSVDLSNPKKPQILGELKIPGFSEYLHPYTDEYLLGIGMDTSEDGMTTNGVKLSMFDVKDPANVSEINKQILKNIYSSDVFYDYKAVLVDNEKNLIGFSANGDTQHYYVYSYDENSGFTCLLDREIGGGWYGSVRGLYVNERFYIVEGYAIEAYDLTTFAKIDDIVL